MNHREISELLPWYANETLEAEERGAIAAHLRDCSECRRDLQGLGEIAQAARELAAEAPEPSGLLLRRTMDRIESYESGKTRKRFQLSELFDRFASSLAGGWAPLPALARAAIVAQFLLLAGLTAFVLSRSGEAPGLGTAGGPSEDRPAAGPKARILVGFQEKLPEETLRQTILGFHGEIVAGPSALGLYTIEVPMRPERTEEVDRLLKDLRRRKDVVRFAEAVP